MELGIYTPWFPVTEKLGDALFKANVSIDPEYTVVSSGTISRTNDEWSIVQSKPEGTCTIIASNKFNCVKQKLNQLAMNVYYVDSELKKEASKIGSLSKWIVENYATQFGVTDSNDFSIVIAPREDGGGYCRQGLVVIMPGDSMKTDSLGGEIKIFRHIAHELAHLWWTKADSTSWEDWLNESFAEYSSLMAVRDKYGKDEFVKLINEYKERAKNLPAIKGIDRGNKRAFEVLYIKGSVLLNELESEVGRERFLRLLQLLHVNEVDTTCKFLKQLLNLTNQDTVDNFSKKLER